MDNNGETPYRAAVDANDSKNQTLKGWTSHLAAFVTAIIVVESVTGLWIYLAPFSVTSQIQVLLHTLAGLIVLVPYFVYQVRHLRIWYNQKFTAIMVLGYALMAMMLICIVSGLVLTWQAVIGPKVSELWDLIHLVSGIAIFALLVFHTVMAYTRRRIAMRQLPDFGLAFKRFALKQVYWVGATAVLVFVAAGSIPVRMTEFPVPEEYGLLDYIQQYDEYRGSPFAPSYARTESGMMVDPDVLAHSASCGTSGCHEQILGEWLPSAHRFAAMNPPFQQVQKNFAVDRQPAETRYCAGCHDPISLFAGAKDIQNLDLSAPGMQEGISCVVCHSMSKVDQRGNADYVLTPPQKYIWETAEGWKKFSSDFLIRAYPRQHLANYDRNLLRTPEFCGSCHKQFIPEALNRFGLTPGQNQYDEWRKSHWHVEDSGKDLSCRDCHMRLVFDSADPGHGEAGDVRRSEDDGAHRHHGSIATNLFMPAVLKLEHWEEQVRLTEEWIRGETVIPEIAHLWPAGPNTPLKILCPTEVNPGQAVDIQVVIENKKVGHNFITGPLDFIRAWVHLTVTDAEGEILFERGNIDLQTRSISDSPGEPHKIGNSRREGTLVFEGMPLDAEGNPLVRHELWKKAGGKGQRLIFPRYSDKQVYQFNVPPKARGPLTVRADLNFRRYRQEFLDLVVPTMEKDSGVYQPIVTKVSDEKHLIVLQTATTTNAQ